MQRPTEEFFGESFGLPLTMNPNFEDLSCEMVFGQARTPCSSSLPIESVCVCLSCRGGVLAWLQ